MPVNMPYVRRCFHLFLRVFTLIDTFVPKGYFTSLLMPKRPRRKPIFAHKRAINMHAIALSRCFDENITSHINRAKVLRTQQKLISIRSRKPKNTHRALIRTKVIINRKDAEKERESESARRVLHSRNRSMCLENRLKSNRMKY